MEQMTLAQLRTEKQQIVSADLQNTWRSDPQAICQCKKCTGGGDIHGHTNNHRREPNNGKVKYIEEADWYRHEEFFSGIIEI